MKRFFSVLIFLNLVGVFAPIEALIISKTSSRHLPFVSQCGQDKYFIEEIFNFKEGGYFVDIGAADGLLYSNTYTLEKFLKWKGICVEAHPERFLKLVQNRPKAINLNTCLDYENHIVDFTICDELGDGIVAEDTDHKLTTLFNPKKTTVKMVTKTLQQILEESNAPHVIDFLSMDVEGAETRILRGFPFDTYTFLAMCIERPSRELNALLQKKGYVIVKNTDLDTYYVHTSISNFDKIEKQPFKKL